MVGPGNCPLIAVTGRMNPSGATLIHVNSKSYTTVAAKTTEDMPNRRANESETISDCLVAGLQFLVGVLLREIVVLKEYQASHSNISEAKTSEEFRGNQEEPEECAH